MEFIGRDLYFKWCLQNWQIVCMYSDDEDEREYSIVSDIIRILVVMVSWLC